MGRQCGQHLHMLRGQAHLFMSLAQGSGFRPAILWVDLASRQGHLPAMVAQT